MNIAGMNLCILYLSCRVLCSVWSEAIATESPFTTDKKRQLMLVSVASFECDCGSNCSSINEYKDTHNKVWL